MAFQCNWSRKMAYTGFANEVNSPSMLTWQDDNVPSSEIYERITPK